MVKNIFERLKKKSLTQEGKIWYNIRLDFDLGWDEISRREFSSIERSSSDDAYILMDQWRLVLGMVVAISLCSDFYFK